METVKQKKLATCSQQLYAMLPLIALVVLVTFFAVATKGQSISPMNIGIIFNQVVVVAVVSLGAIFVYSMGALDLSLGVATAFSAAIGAIVFNNTGSITMMVLTCMAIGVCIAMVTATFCSVLRLQPIYVTIAMMSVLTAMLQWVFGSDNRISLNQDIATHIDTVGVKAFSLLAFYLLCVVLFNLTGIGPSNKALSGNPTVARQSGVSIIKSTYITFLMCGLGVGIGAFLTIARSPTVTINTASSLGLDTLIVIVLGGMPVTGGARSKVTSALIGALSITVLNNGMVIMGVNSGIVQMVRGIVFLVVVFLTCYNQRTKLLAR